MLSAFEREIVRRVLSECGDRESCLMEVSSFVGILKSKRKTANDFKAVLTQLELEGYFEIIRLQKNGIDVFCITPKSKARLIEREKKQIERNLLFKILLAVLSAVTAFVVTKLLYKIF